MTWHRRTSTPELALVQGSITPCTWLARGQIRVVPYTRRIKRMERRGVINVLATTPIKLRSTDG